MKHLFVKRGFVQEFIDREARRLPEQSGFYDVGKYLKRFLNYMKVPFVDPCCDTEKEYATVRYNKTDEVLEFYNITTEEWEVVPTV